MRKSSIFTALGGALLAGGIVFSQENNSPTQQAPLQNLESIAGLTQTDVYFRGVMNELLIRDVVQTHIEMTTPTSIYLKQIQEELEFRLNGDKAKAKEKLLESFSYTHRLCLALAMSYGENEIPEQEFEDLGKKIVGLEHTISTLAQESYVDYLDERVYNVSIEWGKLKTEEYRKLFLASKVVPQGDPNGRLRVEDYLESKENRIEYLKRLYNTAFTPEEYATNIIQREDTISNNIKKTLISTVDRGIIHQATIQEEIRDINESARRIRYGIYYGYFKDKPTLPHQLR